MSRPNALRPNLDRPQRDVAPYLKEADPHIPEDGAPASI
jgi:hypothetical protein